MGKKVKSIALWGSLLFYSVLLRDRWPPKWWVSHKILEKSMHVKGSDPEKD